jgi:hopanoid-associated phosphorylase
MGSGPRLGFVAGLKAEARIFADASPWPVAVAGGSAVRAENMAHALAASGAEVLVSVGIAGALLPTLRPGNLLVADAVLGPDGARYPTDLALAEKFGFPPGLIAVRGAIVGSDVMVTTVRAKADLRDRTGAMAVDMESHGVAHAAASSGLPCLVLRAIADPAERAVPLAATLGMDEEGNTRPAAVARALLGRPGDLPGLVALARDAGAAMRTLRRLAAWFPVAEPG